MLLFNSKAIRVVPHTVREKFPQNLIFKTFEKSKFSIEKSEKCEFFDECFFKNQVLLETFLEQIWLVRHLIRESF